MREFDIGYPHSQTPRVLLEGARTIQNKIAAWGLDQEYYDGARGQWVRWDLAMMAVGLKLCLL